MIVICHHLDIWRLTVGGKLPDFMIHIDTLIAEVMKVSLRQVVESLIMCTTDRRIITWHQQEGSFMTDDHLLERTQGMFHPIPGTCILVLLIRLMYMYSHREQDLRHLMNPGQSCRGHSWVTETIPGLMVRMGIMSITLTEDRVVTEVTQIRGQLGLNHIQWKEALSMAEMSPTMTRCAFLSIDAYKMYMQFRMSVYMYCFGSVYILSILKFKQGIPPLVLATTQIKYTILYFTLHKHK